MAVYACRCENKHKLHQYTKYKTLCLVTLKVHMYVPTVYYRQLLCVQNYQCLLAKFVNDIYY